MAIKELTDLPGGRYSQNPLELTSTFVLKVESKSSSALKKERGKGGTLDAVFSSVCGVCVWCVSVCAVCMNVGVLPVVQKDVWGPNLVCGKTQVFYARVFRLVPLEIMIEPALIDIKQDLE